MRDTTLDAITTPHVDGDEDIGAIKDILGFHIRLAHGAVYRHFMETFADLEKPHPMDRLVSGAAADGPRDGDGDRQPVAGASLHRARQIG